MSRLLIFLYPIGLVALPLFGLFLRASSAISNPDASQLAFGPEAQAAYAMSLFGAILAARVNGIGGFLVAWILSRYDFPGKGWLDAAVDLPFSLPTSVAGLTLLSIYNPETGVLGQWLTNHNIRVAFSPLAVLLSRVFVSFPFVIRSIQPILGELEPELEEAALSLGARPFDVFRLVIWPATKPAWITGTALAFARSVGEFGSVVRLSSNRVFYDLTAPVLVFQSLENYQLPSAALIGTIRLILSLGRLVGINALAISKRLFSRVGFMSFTVLIRDALESLPAGAPASWSETFEFIGVRFERALQTLIQFIFLGGWARQFIDLPIVVPQLAEARTWLPSYGSLQFPVPEEAFSSSSTSNVFSSGFAFREGLLNGLFLGLPLTLSHVLVFKRRYIQGLPQGLTARASYRLGETVLLCLTGRGRGTFFHQWDPLPLLFGLWLTARVVYEIVYLRRTGLQRVIPYIAGLHFTFAFIEQGVVLGTLGSQTLDTAATAARLWVGPGAWLAAFSYGFGLFFSSLRLDAVCLSFALWAVEKIFIWLQVQPELWRRRIDRVTTNLIAAFAITSIPFYTADYISRNILGFHGRDSELSKLLTRVFYSLHVPGEEENEEPVSRVFEGHYTTDIDSYGRSSPDRLRDPASRGDLAVENISDPVDEAFITRNVSQRVDVVFLRGWEESLYEWIHNRLDWISSNVLTGGRYEEEAEVRTKEKTTAQQRLPVVVALPTRDDLGNNLAPSVQETIDAELRTERATKVEGWAERRELWYRAAQTSEFTGFANANLPIARTEDNHPEGLTALYHTALNPHQFLSGFLLPVEQHRPLRYENALELGRKRRARRSPLQRAVITGYRDYLLSRQPGELITTAEDQLGLYRARLALDDYLTAARSYHEAEQGIDGLTNNKTVALRGAAQRRLDWVRFNGRRGQQNTIYSQQYTGNLHLIRRLFVISWDPRETKIATGIRRKLALDQLAPQHEPVIREHEELGQANTLNLQPTDFYEGPYNGEEPNWVILPDTVEVQDTEIHPSPLYAGWDQERRALVLTNRILPPERAIRSGPTIGGTEDGPWVGKRNLADSTLAKALKTGNVNRRNFTVWPRNDQVIRTENERNAVNLRANLVRRRPVRDPNLLAWDRTQWATESVVTETSNTTFSFWRNPRSEASTNSKEPTPARSTQLFPITFDLAFRAASHTPGLYQPTARGGLLWPGQARDAWFSSTAWRPHGEFTEWEDEVFRRREKEKRERAVS